MTGFQTLGTNWLIPLLTVSPSGKWPSLLLLSTVDTGTGQHSPLLQCEPLLRYITKETLLISLEVLWYFASKVKVNSVRADQDSNSLTY